MIDLNKLENPCIMICPRDKKDILIKNKSQNNVSLNIKFITKQEIINNLLYSYDYETLLYVAKNYNYSFETADEILKNLKKECFFNEKLKHLSSIIKDLKEHNLIKENKLFKNLFKNKTCYIYGYSSRDKELKNALETIGVTYTFLSEEKTQFQHEIYKFNEMEEEVNNLFIEIMHLLNNGISLNKIYLYDYSSDYAHILDKYAHYHNLPIEFKTNYYLYDSPLFKKFIEYLKDEDISDAFLKIKNETSFDPFDAINKIVTAISEISYLNLEKEEFIKLLSYIAKKTHLKSIKYKESIKICNATSIINDDEYAFMLGFSADSYPPIYKDIDFYSDEEKDKLGLNDSKTKTLIASEQLEHFILHTKNLYISYKKKYNKTVYYKSTLVKKLDLKELESKVSDERFSISLSELEVANYLDYYYNYGNKNAYMHTYSEEELKYKKFDHHFKGIANFNLDYLPLSATVINEYNKCAFQYFVKRILKANIFEDSFEMNLGSLYHKILEDSITKKIELKDYDEEIANTFKTAKERFFVENLLPQVEKVIAKNERMDRNSKFNKKYAEKEVKLNIDDKTVLVGIIDKTLIDEEEKNLIIVDYKTGNFKFNKDKVKYGVDMQLPIYALMMNEIYKDHTNVGVYIQNVCIDEKDEIEEPYKLEGITLNDLDRIKRMDQVMGNFDKETGQTSYKSSFISGISLNKDGSLSKKSANKMLNKEDFDALIKTTNEQILLTENNIRSGKFPINPVAFDNENLPCLYCPCIDICFKRSEDIRHIDLKKEGEEQ